MLLRFLLITCAAAAVYGGGLPTMPLVNLTVVTRVRIFNPLVEGTNGTDEVVLSESRLEETHIGFQKVVDMGAGRTILQRNTTRKSFLDLSGVNCTWHNVTNVAVNIFMNQLIPSTGGKPQPAILGLSQLMTYLNTTNWTLSTALNVSDEPQDDPVYGRTFAYTSKVLWLNETLNATVLVAQKQLLPISLELRGNSTSKGIEAGAANKVVITLMKFEDLRLNQTECQPSQFLIPDTVFCPLMDEPARALPLLPNHMHAEIEERDEHNRIVTLKTELMDLVANVGETRFELPATPLEDSVIFVVDKWLVQVRDEIEKYFGVQATRQINVVSDYSQGVQFVIVRDGPCLVQPIGKTWPEGDDVVDGFVKPAKSTYHFWGLDSLNFTREGPQHWRGIPVTTWSSVHREYPQPGQFAVVKLYFMADDWQYQNLVQPRLPNATHIVGIKVIPYNATTNKTLPIGQYHANIIEMDWSLTEEFWWSQKLMLCYQNFAVNGSFYKITTSMSPVHFISLSAADRMGLISNISAALGKGAGISPLRFSELEFIDSGTAIRFNLLGRLINDSGLPANSSLFTTADMAVAQLNKTLSTIKLPVTVHNRRKESAFVVTFMEISRATAPVNPQPVPPAPSTGDKSEGYTSGAMAALAICMLLVGVALTIGAILLKKRFGSGDQFAYMVQTD